MDGDCFGFKDAVRNLQPGVNGELFILLVIALFRLNMDGGYLYASMYRPVVRLARNAALEDKAGGCGVFNGTGWVVATTLAE